MNTRRKQFINKLYNEYLKREIDETGITTYVNSNFTVDEVRDALLKSNEYNELPVMTNFGDTEFTFITHNRLKDLVVSKQIFETKSWEPHISKIIIDALTPGGLFIDIGSNIGWHAKVAQNAGYDVIAFEPDPENFSILKKNCSKEGSTLYNLALGDIETELFLEKDPNNYGNTWVSNTNFEGDKVKSVRLDDILNEDIALKTNVVKMDVQGYETKILEGGIKFFNSLRKGTVIITEISVWRPEFNLELFLNVLHTDVTESYALCYWWNSNPVPLSEALEYISKQPNINEIEGRLEFDLVIIK